MLKRKKKGHLSLFSYILGWSLGAGWELKVKRNFEEKERMRKGNKKR